MTNHLSRHLFQDYEWELDLQNFSHIFLTSGFLRMELFDTATKRKCWKFFLRGGLGAYSLRYMFLILWMKGPLYG